MSYQFDISDIGLRLIKAYEGFWPEARSLMTGGQVIGFGHRVDTDETLTLTEDEAEEVLKADLAPIEDLINSRVHASMTQSQFDALCSLVFSIGEEAFMSSNMLHALNQGQVLEAANEFDLWRKGNVEGRVYVVDALVRRRTAEKALFLRPTQRIARAPRFELAPVRDGGWVESSEPSFASGLQQQARTPRQRVQTETAPLKPRRAPEPVRAPEPAKPAPRRELAAAPAKVIYADEIADSDTRDLTMLPQAEASAELSPDPALIEPALNPEEVSVADLLEQAADEDGQLSGEEADSPIAAAAAEVSQRLDALIDEPKANQAEEWPDNLITSSITPAQPSGDNVVRIGDTDGTSDVIIDELKQDDALQEQIARESQYNVDRFDNYVDMPDDGETKRSFWVFLSMIVIGMIAALSGLIINLRGSTNILGENGPFIAIAAMLLGGLLLVVGLLYLMKLMFARE